MRFKLIPLFLLLAVVGFQLGDVLESQFSKQQEPRRLLRHQGYVRDFAGGVMALSDDGGTIQFLQTSTAQQIGPDLKTHPEGYGRLSPDGSTYSWVEDKVIRVLDVHRGRVRSQAKLKLERNVAVWGLSRDGSRALLGCWDDETFHCFVADTKRGTILFRQETSDRGFKSAVLAGDGKTVVVSTAAGVELVQVSNGRRKLIQKTPSVLSSENKGTWFATKDGDTMSLRHFRNGKRVKSPLRCGQEFAMMRSVDNSGRRAGIWRSDNQLQIWDLKSGAKLAERYSYSGGGCLSEVGNLMGVNGRWENGNSCEVYEVDSGKRLCDLSSPNEYRAIFLVDDRLKSRVAWVVDPRLSCFAVEAWSF